MTAIVHPWEGRQNAWRPMRIGRSPRRQAEATGRPLGRKGASAAEFALVAVPATLLFCSVMEVGWQTATMAALDHAALRAARFGATGAATPAGRSGLPTNPCRSAAIPWFASSVTGGFLRPERMTVVLNSYTNFNGSAARSGGSAGAGTGGQVVTYELSYAQPLLLGGLVRIVTDRTSMTYRATLTVKNEPFDDAVC